MILKSLYSIKHLISSLILFAAAGFQMVGFLLIARALGVDAFGQYSAVLAFVLPMAEFGGFGSGDRMISRVSRNQLLFPYLYTSCLFTTMVTGVAASLVTIVLCYLFLGQGLSVMPLAALVLAEIVFARLSGIVDQSFIAFRKLIMANMIRLIVALARCSYGVFLLFNGSIGLVNFVYGLLIISVIVSLITHSILIYVSGWPKRSRRIPLFFPGASFAVHQCGRVVGQSVDRMVLALVLVSEQLGVYNAGARVLMAMLIPLASVVRDKYPGFFVAGKKGLRNTILYAKAEVVPVLSKVVFASVIACLILSVCLPYLLGEGYENAMYVGFGMTGAGALLAVQYVLGETLTGAGFQRTRMIATLLTVGLAAAEMYLFATAFGLFGAIVGLLLSQTTGIAVLLLFIGRELGREKDKHKLVKFG